ncbi:MAG: VOC family protein [Syntrophaceae bacterium]|nr:VOC family protein [Syntrophaceae bacterium]
MGLKSVGVEEVAEQKVRVAFLPIGETEIELLESTAPDGPWQGTSRRTARASSTWRCALDNLEAALAELKAQGVRLIDEKPRYGAGGAKIAFVHPAPRAACCSELSERE